MCTSGKDEAAKIHQQRTLLVMMVRLQAAWLPLSTIADFALTTFMTGQRRPTCADVVSGLVAIELGVAVTIQELTQDVVREVQTAPSAVHAVVVFMVAARAYHQRATATGAFSWRHH